MSRLEGKRVLITAAGQGMGRAAALAMSSEGAQVFASDIDPDLLADLSRDDKRIETFVLDVTQADQIAAAPERTGPLTTLFNCAGYVHNGTIMDMDDDDWDFSFNLNVRAQFRMIRAYLPGMIAQGGWINHQYGFGCILHQRSAKQVSVWRDKGGGSWPDPCGCG